MWTRRTGKGPYRVLRNGSCSTMQIELSLKRNAKSPGVQRGGEKEGSCSTIQIELSLERSAKSPGVKRG